MEKITYLEGFEAIRKRPGMYVGSTEGHGIIVILQEVIKMLNYELNWVHLTIIRKDNQFIIRLKQPMTYTNEINNLHPYRNIESHQKEFSVLGFSGVIALSKRIELRFKNRFVIYKDSKEVKNEIQEKVANFEMRFELDETIMEVTTISANHIKNYFQIYLELSDFDNRTIEIIGNNNYFHLTKKSGLQYLFNERYKDNLLLTQPIIFEITNPLFRLKANIIFSIVRNIPTDINYYPHSYLFRGTVSETFTQNFINGLVKVSRYHNQTNFSNLILNKKQDKTDENFGIVALIHFKYNNSPKVIEPRSGCFISSYFEAALSDLVLEGLKENKAFLAILNHTYFN